MINKCITLNNHLVNFGQCPACGFEGDADKNTVDNRLVAITKAHLLALCDQIS
jgi:hypothetical protein